MKEQDNNGAGTGKRPLIGTWSKAFLFLAAFALLGIYCGRQVILLTRALFGGAVLIMAARLFWLTLAVWATVYCFRKFKTVRQAAGPSGAKSLLLLAWLAFLGGAAGYRAQYRSPAATMMEETEAEWQACSNHVSSVLHVKDVSDSHEPGSGYIKVKGTFTARTRLLLKGGGWLRQTGGGDASFSAEMNETELLPGQPKELTFYLLANPEHSTGKPLVSDGPYFIPAITAYVHDPARKEHWATWAGKFSCKAPVINNYTTGPYKAATMGRLKWLYEGDYDFLAPAKPAPKQAPAAGDPLLEEAQRLLQEAEDSLRRAKASSPGQ